MKTAEQIEVTGRSAEELSQPKNAVRSIQIQPLSSVLPNVSPIHDLQMMTKRLQRVDRIYAVVRGEGGDRGLTDNRRLAQAGIGGPSFRGGLRFAWMRGARTR